MRRIELKIGLVDCEKVCRKAGSAINFALFQIGKSLEYCLWIFTLWSLYGGYLVLWNPQNGYLPFLTA